MQENEILTTLYNGEITAQDAYDSIYSQTPSLKQLKRARYLRMRITLPDESAALNSFLRMLFIFPIPLWLFSFSFNFANKFSKLEEKLGDDINPDEIKTLIKHARGTKIHIVSDDAIIRIDIS